MSLNYTDIMKPEEISIEKIWLGLAAALFKNKPVSKLQHDEIRRIFYMGFTECFKIMLDLSLELPEDQTNKILTRLQNEAKEFHAKEIGKLIPYQNV